LEVQTVSGRAAPHQRAAAIRRFQEGPKASDPARPRVFVMTIRTGAVGVTLTAAHRVYLPEPCLDPVTEAQTAGRIHRHG